MSVKFLCPGHTNGDWLVIKPIDKVYKGEKINGAEVMDIGFVSVLNATQSTKELVKI